jgi:hypothetical protein
VQGEHVGIVENVAGDPKQLLRAQVRVPHLFTEQVPTSDLPWAEYKLPTGSRPMDGNFTPCKVGDIVWVDFPYNGDTRRPRITGSKHFTPDGTPNFPEETYGARYHKDVVFNQNGITIEMVDDGDGIYRITQKGTGTKIEIDKSGKVTIDALQNEVIIKGSIIRLN